MTVATMRLAYNVFQMILDIHDTDTAIAAYKAADDDMKDIEGNTVTSSPLFRRIGSGLVL